MPSDGRLFKPARNLGPLNFHCSKMCGLKQNGSVLFHTALTFSKIETALFRTIYKGRYLEPVRPIFS